MHFEILVEDLSGKKCLELLLPKMVRNSDTVRVHSYKGIGRIPKNLKNKSDPSKRILLDQLPRLLRGYGNAFANYGGSYQAVVIIICDLDDKCLRTFRQEILDILENCNPKPDAHICIAIEEGEAWFLGDLQAIKKAYPRAKNDILNSYKNDSICGTWELLADAILPGGSAALRSEGWHAVGTEKSRWAEAITPHMDVSKNSSPSFNYFCEKITGN